MAEPKRVTRVLRDALEQTELIELQRGVLGCVTEQAFVVGLGRSWALLHAVDETFRLDGYRAVRRRDIARARPSINRVAARSLALRGERPVAVPELELDRTRDVLRSGTEAFRIVTVHTEYHDADICYVGAVGRLGGRRFSLDELAPDARWTRSDRYPYAAVSRVDLDGAYERALLAVADDDAAATEAGATPSPVE